VPIDSAGRPFDIIHAMMPVNDSTRPTVPVRAGYGNGRYRRCIVLQTDDTVVSGELADDFHHFAVRLRHDGRRVVSVEGEDVRVPWTTCPGALEPLRRMRGARLSTPLPELLRFTPAREQCTHWHDLACLAIAHAARAASGGSSRRRYDVTVADRVDGRTVCELARDARTRLRWRMHQSDISESTPELFRGRTLSGRDFRRFCAGLDDDLAEAAWVLRRAIFIGLGRQHDFENIAEASTFAPVVGAACHTFDPARIGDARRVYGTLRDFSDTPLRILDRD